MFGRIAEVFGYKAKKDEALAKRFAQIRNLYDEPSSEGRIDAIAIRRTGLNMRAVVGAEKSTGELLRKNLLESYARTAEHQREPVASK